jgi:hypothetical protein
MGSDNYEGSKVQGLPTIRSPERHLKHFGLMDDGGKAITFSEWATLA